MMKGAITTAAVILAVGVGGGALLAPDSEVAPQDAAARGSVSTNAGSTQQADTQPSPKCDTEDSSGDAQDRQDADPADTPDPQGGSDRQDGDSGNTPDSDTGSDP
jgi:hypothetical protein